MARTKAGLSQEDLAVLVGKPPGSGASMISKWERGERNPRLPNVSMLDDALKARGRLVNAFFQDQEEAANARAAWRATYNLTYKGERKLTAEQEEHFRRQIEQALESGE